MIHTRNDFFVNPSRRELVPSTTLHGVSPRTRQGKDDGGRWSYGRARALRGSGVCCGLLTAARLGGRVGRRASFFNAHPSRRRRGVLPFLSFSLYTASFTLIIFSPQSGQISSLISTSSRPS